jgi:hypothetical protein
MYLTYDLQMHFCGDNSALWVAEWLNMQNSFTNNIIGVVSHKWFFMVT